MTKDIHEVENGLTYTFDDSVWPPRLVFDTMTMDGETIDLIQTDVIGFQKVFAEHRIGNKRKA